MSSGTMRLLESMDPSAVKEYRINDGKVEARILECVSDQESAWWELTPEQLSIHVRRNIAVARWLERTLGWRPLLRACVAQ
jgi:hypothetical protein